MVFGDRIIKKDKNRSLVNDKITAPKVHLIMLDGEQVGIVPLEQALQAAREASLDLVQMNDGEPPVCKVMDFGKRVYEQKKQKAAARKKQVKTTTKEIKFRPGTDVGDYQVKLRNLIRFLEHGDKAKVTIRFRGREMAHQELGMTLLKRVEEDLQEHGIVEMFPKLEGRQMAMVIAPKKKK